MFYNIIYLGDDIIKHINLIKKINNVIYLKNELKNSDYLLSNINGYSLDIEQRKAVINDTNATLVIAGAGSGKSLTIIGKIRYIIERKNVNPNDILCISFTNEASNSLMNKIKSVYNYDINVYTFHKLSLNLMKDKKYSIAPPDTLEYIINEYFFLFKMILNL